LGRAVAAEDADGATGVGGATGSATVDLPEIDGLPSAAGAAATKMLASCRPWALPGSCGASKTGRISGAEASAEPGASGPLDAGARPAEGVGRVWGCEGCNTGLCDEENDDATALPFRTKP
jgi:hypothetical protein